MQILMPELIILSRRKNWWIAWLYCGYTVVV